MRQINFIPSELRPKHEIPGILLPAGLFLLLFFYIGGSVIGNIVAKRQSEAELVRLDTENAELTKKIEALSDSKERMKLDEAIGNMKKVLAKKNYWSAIFREMSVLMPEGVWLTGFSDHQEQDKQDKKSKPDTNVLLIKGEASSQDIIAQFLTGLEKSNHFAGVRMKVTEKEENISPARYKFEFTIPIKTATNGSG